MRMLEKDPSALAGMDDVVAVCGRPSLRHDDPVRGEMITLAKAGAGSALMAQNTTPTSRSCLEAQSPRQQSLCRTPPAGSRFWWGLGGLGSVAIAAAIWWLLPGAPGRRPGARRRRRTTRTA